MSISRTPVRRPSRARARSRSRPIQGFSLALTYPTAAEAKRVFDVLAEGGRVTMPVQQVFWAEAFGMLVDRFGTPWMVNGAMMSA